MGILLISAGALTPTFSKTTYAYSSTVGFNVASTTVTAVLEDANAQLKINGVAAVSGQPSSAIPLAVGNNTIPIQVTPQIGPVQNYSVMVTRPDSTRLTSLTAIDNLNNQISLKPSFDSNTTLYNVCIPQDSTATTLNITPVKEGVNATIAVNGTAVTSGMPWPVTIPEVGGSVSIPFKVSAPQLADTTYTVNVAKATSAYLQSVTGIPGVNFVKTTYDYTTSITAPKVKATVIPEDTSATIEVTINGTSVPYTQRLIYTLNTGLNELIIKVTSSFGGDSKTYAFHITKS
ncbi:cadherin-like beta sandwich domain-containing protein [Anaerotignum propionicum]|uniref:Cadherin-like beta sandwich domain protein n=1 Tax=Anaerotignum propionicum DSM 1682 TaxID=991789 RepID=A0A0X1U8U3_ANAPI|nr:cadherin-like beta sandwich domain-containing protein [Anaerotignum propionicum]AMJ41351.1 cadherin-like beta sandwich domain protein [Anaerotignum propionicum DSM 1682]SHE97629.1 Cadherin-like beta sandwich domain-containing protein [[Clostridium] propionicum DSM 1682] [Anaerotignum propionicum DSM 1682]